MSRPLTLLLCAVLLLAGGLTAGPAPAAAAQAPLAAAAQAPLAAAAQAPLAAAAPTRSPDPAGVHHQDLRIPVRDGPARDQAQSLDATVYLPARTPAPAMLLAHGFGGTKDSVAREAGSLAARGYVVLAWTATGFGASTGEIHLDSADHEVADAAQLVDWLAGRPDVVHDGPGDPRVGVTGASYGGALALLLAGTDPRVDVDVPLITWNDLGRALFPNDAAPAATGAPPAGTPAAAAGTGDGVLTRGWAGVFFGSGGGPGAEPSVCGRFAPDLCAGYVEAARTGREPPALAAALAASSPASVAGRIHAPTLLVQGEADTLFGLDQSDATAREIAAGGGRVATAWFAGGHDAGQEPDAATSGRMAAWFDHYLRGVGPVPDTSFTYTLPSGVRSRAAPTQRVVTAPAYPGLPGTPPVARTSLALHGDPETVLAPAGGIPAALSSLPGLAAGGGGTGGSGRTGGGGSGGGGGTGGGGLSALLGRLATDLPGQAATFRTDPLPARTVISGAPRIDLRVAARPGSAPPDGQAVLFGKVYDDAGGGARTLLGGAVAPVRVPVAPDGTPTPVTVTLPGVVGTVAAGHRLEVALATTDQAYAPGATPAVYRVAAGGTLSVPSVAGEVRGGTTVPWGTVLAVAVLLAGVLLAVVVARLLAGRRRRRGGAGSADPALREVPLVARGVSKAFPSGVRAVDDVSFSVPRGRVVGLLGPNGAGKTTVLRMLLGLVRPGAGELRVFGERVEPGAPVLARLGSFVEGAGFLPHLSGRENLVLYWRATGRPGSDAHLEEALAVADLGDAVHRPVRTYSQGMRQRLAIAQAMLGQPDLLVLDEPTNGLDPPQIHAMRDVLRSYASGGEHGRTVLVSSHLLAEVEQTCSDVVVMHRGRVAAAGTVDELVADGRLAVSVSGARDRAVAVADALPGVTAHADPEDPELLVVDLPGPSGGDPDARARVVRALVDAGVDVVGVGPRRRLEDAFLALVGEEGTP